MRRDMPSPMRPSPMMPTLILGTPSL